tara:strand:- start:872 stop:1501 length:630 start_codon:yes stop_codon:yes gene_type:complete
MVENKTVNNMISKPLFMDSMLFNYKGNYFIKVSVLSMFMEIFAKGKRGKIFLLGKVAVKYFFDWDRALNEAEWLLKLNEKGVGPKLLYYSSDFIAYEFVEGEMIKDFVGDVKPVLVNVLEQCYIMDKMGMNKLEMHHPLKHVLIGKKVVLIDFERCYYTPKPKNVSQFCTFIVRYGYSREKLLPLVRKYKKSYLKKDFLRILNYVQAGC